MTIDLANGSVALFLLLFAVFFGAMIAATNRFRLFDTPVAFGSKPAKPIENHADGCTWETMKRAARRRLLLGFVVTNLLPVLYALGIVVVLNKCASVLNPWSFLAAFVFAVGAFGFNRLWGLLFAWEPSSRLVYCCEKERGRIAKESPSGAASNVKGHVVSTILYVVGALCLGAILVAGGNCAG